MKKKNGLKRFEKSYLILFMFFMIEIFLIYLNIYLKQNFPIEQFVLIIIQLLSVLLSYFLGLLMAGIFSIVYVVGLIVYIMNKGLSLNVISYTLLFLIPLVLLFAGNMKRSRDELKRDLHNLEKLKASHLKIDPYTLLENEVAFEEILEKHRKLSERYKVYYFSVSMFRLEFISTLRTILDVKDFNQLIEDIANIIQTSIRTEDYKFILDNNRFAIITPLTSKENIKPAIRRILEKIERITVQDRNGETINITVKYSSLDYLQENDEIFKDYKKLILELQKATEVDVHGEYYN